MKFIIYLTFLLCQFKSVAQDGHEYYRLISLAESQFVKGNLNDALDLYDTAFHNFDYPFYRHIRQATIIASYTSNTNKYHEYLVKCVERGMTLNELDFFYNRYPNDTEVQKIYTNYNKYRNDYLSSLDTLVLLNFLELDVFESLSIERIKDNDMFLEKMKIYGRRYMALVDSLGYPTEIKTGLSYRVFASLDSRSDKIANWKQHKVSYNKDISPVKGDLYGNIGIEEHIDKPISMKAGNWFLSHYHAEGYIIDSTFFKYLERGVYNLKLDQITIALFLEKTGLGNHEFLMTYYSPLLLSMNMKMHKIYKLNNSIKLKINENRKRYYIRTIETELGIIKRLYFLENGENLKKISKKMFKNISYQTDSFIKYS